MLSWLALSSLCKGLGSVFFFLSFFFLSLPRLALALLGMFVSFVSDSYSRLSVLCLVPPEVPFDDGVLSNLDVQVVRSGW